MDKQQSQDGRRTNRDTGKPNKRDFYNLVVIAPNGTVIDDQDWKKVGGGKQGGDLRKALKAEGRGWTPVRVFNEAEYEKARAEFKDLNKKSTQESRKSIIQQAFADAEVEHNPRIESALRILLQLMDPNNEKRTGNALRNVVRAVDAAMTDEAREKGRSHKGKDAQSDKGKDGEHDHQAKSDNEAAPAAA